MFIKKLVKVITDHKLLQSHKEKLQACGLMWGAKLFDKFDQAHTSALYPHLITQWIFVSREASHFIVCPLRFYAPEVHLNETVMMRTHNILLCGS